MSPVKRRRRLPTLINRGLGLLEVILPRGASETVDTALPAGQRDPSGFWFPTGYDKPGDIFSPLQKELQENQRRIQRRRLRHSRRPPVPAGGDGTMTVHGSSGGAHSPPQGAPVSPTHRPPATRTSTSAPVSSEITVPLPSLLPQTGAPPAIHAPCRSSFGGQGRSSPAGSSLLPDPDASALAPPRVVDSREGSD